MIRIMWCPRCDTTQRVHEQMRISRLAFLWVHGDDVLDMPENEYLVAVADVGDGAIRYLAGSS